MGPSGGPRPVAQHATQVSTSTLLNALHSFYMAGQPYQLDSSTSLVVNTWVAAATTLPDGRNGATVDRDLAMRAWEHARRRAEDGCIILWYVFPQPATYSLSATCSLICAQLSSSVDPVSVGTVHDGAATSYPAYGLHGHRCPAPIPLGCDFF